MPGRKARAGRGARLRAAKRLAGAVRRKRLAVEASHAQALAKELAAYFAGLAKRIGPRSTKAALDVDDLADWDAEERQLGAILRRSAIRTAGTAAEHVADTLQVDTRFDLGSRGIRALTDTLGHRVRGITEETRDRLAGVIDRSIAQGDSVEQIRDTLRETARQWTGLEDISRSRAAVIARTETAHAYTWSSARAYRESGVVDRVLCLDSPDCGWDGHDDPELADGTERSFDEMEMFPTSHPNCVRAFAPIVGAAED